MTLRWTKFIKGDDIPLYQPETMPSKDQQSIDEPTSYEKWDRARTLMLESLHKPDNALRSCAHNQQCYYELMDIKDQVIESAGADVLVDAVAVSAHFYMMTRIADATGTPLDAGSVEPSIQIRELVGVNAFTSRREAQK